MDAAEYKHVVLGLIFLKYISDAFKEKHAALAAEVDQGADPEDADEYRAESKYEDVAGFCKEASREEIGKHDFVLTPGRYVGAEEVEDDGVPFKDKMAALSTELREQFVAGAELEKKIETARGGLGFGR